VAGTIRSCATGRSSRHAVAETTALRLPPALSPAIATRSGRAPSDAACARAHANAARALEQDEVVFAVALQANRGAEAAEAGADDRKARVARRSLVRAHGSNG
jgi:hypothetical protein